MSTSSTPQSSPSSSAGTSPPPTSEKSCYPYPLAMFYNPWNAFQADPYHPVSPSSMTMYGMPIHYPMLPHVPPFIAGEVKSHPQNANPTIESKTTLVTTKLSPIKEDSKSLNKSSQENVEPTGNRTNYSKKQVDVLDCMFSMKAYPNPEDFEKLEKELNIPMKCLKVWFQNKRARSKKRVKGQTVFATMIPQPPSWSNMSTTEPKSLPSPTSRSPTADLSPKLESGTIHPSRKSLSPNGLEPITKSQTMLLPAHGQPHMMPPMPYYPGYMSYPMFTYPYMYPQCR